ncbi:MULTISPECIES: ABC transporter substrate-binding protein [unclassified Polaromonas]|jgi:ABC-type branched-subunit amino acid transport system substrate-binding protein|uniref:ABC transporter substrate-binding protein n=1 Tax=unclassified Polaromonas TaxID=2638319 RepID=UPI000BC4F311|nr:MULTISPECIES: ABC transporter substrate-binding protein [unclassified Polaromonas]OYY35887.1 MAG: ABC transporter substrate-binding protein [Polaromonas sp. 35-63-35]OYZ19807.1 MAG: ABC transporter substrate-binding protein [Polaromonas sp. 16-63-31]OYZ79924.1 MAG: ABC transporter substrate-binding protein [Polaromonas sp. 24-63-21]OZA52041.1 MAG: ABC transporter substrate-binding protein [Polaromonas sp. 17-63-33]OZA87927.1 MAG: ABC transporter substrate-binding protein [Polaromonas sp. 39
MRINRRALVMGGLAAGVATLTPLAHSQTGKGGRKLVIGQSVPLTGAADQIGLAYLNGAKLYFDAINAKNGAAGYRIEVKTLDDGYNPAKAAANARQLIDEGVDALFGFVGTASCDAAFAVAKPANTLFFAPFAASDGLREAALSNAFHIRPALADEAYKMVRHCATLSQDRIAVFAEDDAMGRAGLAAVNQALVDLKRPPLVASAFAPVNSDKVEAAVALLAKAQPQAIIQVSLFNTSAAFIRAMRKTGFAGQFLNFSVVGIDPLFTALGKEIGGVVISQVVPSPRSAGTPIIKEYLDVLNVTDQTPSYESVEGYIAARTFAEGVRRSAAGGGKADRAGLQKAFESMTDYDVGGFRVNLRAKKYESVRLVDLVTITPDGKVVR